MFTCGKCGKAPGFGCECPEPNIGQHALSCVDLSQYAWHGFSRDSEYVDRILKLPDDEKRKQFLEGSWDDDARREPVFKNIPIRIDPTLPKDCIAVEGPSGRVIFDIGGDPGDPPTRE